MEGGFTPLLAIIQRSANNRMIYDLQPGLDMTFGHRQLRTNTDGMRSDQEFTRPKPEGIFRIVGIGDSFMFGWGDNDFYHLFLVEKSWDMGASHPSVLYSLLFYRTETLEPRLVKASELEAADIDPEILKYTSADGVKLALSELRGIARKHGFPILLFGAMIHSYFPPTQREPSQTKK